MTRVGQFLFFTASLIIMNANGISGMLSCQIMVTQTFRLPVTISPYLDTCKAVKEENQSSLEPMGESLTNAPRSKQFFLLSSHFLLHFIPQLQGRMLSSGVGSNII